MSFLLPVFSCESECRRELEDDISQPEVHPSGSDKSMFYLVTQKFPWISCYIFASVVERSLSTSR